MNGAIFTSPAISREVRLLIRLTVVYREIVSDIRVSQNSTLEPSAKCLHCIYVTAKSTKGVSKYLCALS